MSTQKDCIRELETELAMRRKVWRELRGTPGQFASVEHTKRYAVLSDTLELLRTMTPAEFHLITSRAERQRAEAAKQTEMF